MHGPASTIRFHQLLAIRHASGPKKGTGTWLPKAIDAYCCSRMRIEEEFGDAPWLTNDWMRPIAGQQQHIDTLEQHGKTAALPASRLLSRRSLKRVQLGRTDRRQPKPKTTGPRGGQPRESNRTRAQGAIGKGPSNIRIDAQKVVLGRLVASVERTAAAWVCVGPCVGLDPRSRRHLVEVLPMSGLTPDALSVDALPTLASTLSTFDGEAVASTVNDVGFGPVFRG